MGTDALDELAAAGVNLFRTGPSGRDWDDALLDEASAWGDAAADRGVLTWVTLRELASAPPGTPVDARLRGAGPNPQEQPRVGFWKGADEPWPRLAPPALSHAFTTVKTLDPAHLVHTIFGPFSIDGSVLLRPPDPPDLSPYNTVTDTHGTNVYPVYQVLQGREPKLHMVGRWMAALRRATGRDAVTMTLQICFAGSQNRDTGEFVMPTKRQERYMIYDAIVNGARGLVFFGGEQGRCQGSRDRALGWNWTFWRTALRDLVAEIGALSPIHAALLRPETTVQLRTSDPRTTAISRPQTAVTSG